MIPGDRLLNAFIDANILFVVAFALWNVARFVLHKLGMKHAHATELKILNCTFLAIAFSPFVILALNAFQSAGIAKGVSINFSDMIVSHYLSGGIQMKASEFEQLLLLRETLTQNVVGVAGWGATAVIAAFVAGLLVGFGRLVFSVYCLHRIVEQSYAWRSFGRVRIRLSDRVLAPFSSRGTYYYYVVIPSGMLTQKNELAVSLAHEFQHLRQGDIEWEILLEVLKPFFFLNPAYHAWKRKVEDLRELACDSQVLTRGRIGVRDYCDTLLSVCQKTLRRDRAFVIAVPKVTLVTADRSASRIGKMGSLERRVSSMHAETRLSYPRLVFCAVGGPMIAATIFTAVAIQRPGDWSHDRLMLSTVVNLERLDEINRISATRPSE
jgi:beta-lactamase regulating signal transducer with metallopeptidase domain